MKMNWSLKLIAAFTVASVALASCKKEAMITPPALSTFTGEKSGNYIIKNVPNSVFRIPVGVTTVSDKDRTINFTVTSPTGAAAGQQYSLSGTSVVIPAGQATGFIDVKGIYSGYTPTRLDTLRFVMNSGDEVAASNYNGTYTLLMRTHCPIKVSEFLGEYSKTYDYSNGSNTADWGPYPTTITATTPGVYGTKDTLRIANFWDWGNPLDLEIDWTNAASPKTTVIDSYVFTDNTYGVIRAKARGTGTFSSCDQTFTVNFSLYAAAGTFSDTFTTTLKR